MPDLLAARVRLHVVTGKGGTGKTTVAAALGVALARRGRRVLLVEVEERQGIARVFDTAPLGYEARSLVRVPGGELLGLSVEAKAALLEYLEVFYRLGRAGRALDRIGAVDFATTIAPGLRDVLLTGKVYDAVRLKRGRRRGDGPYAYDHVVVDAPPTGRIGRFLNVNADVAELARMGPVHSQAAAMTEVFRASATAVHLVTLLEDMPVQETVDAATELRGLGLPLGGLLVNQVRPTLVDADRLADVAAGHVDVAALRTGLQEAGVPGRRPKVRAEALAQQAVEHAQRVQREASLRGRLHEVGLPVVELPQLHGGRDGLHHGGVHELADALTAWATTPAPPTTSGAPQATAGRA
ncbi:ArsA-related P-loop ATPase [Aquipuribacter nitratireducens]|uniref:ArsA-related P-loop ATPase n=1 Tax=Aquipuribacter nitratireducens TaxID=650104 RepID=A0ABW0GQX3_9MICO